MTSQLTNILFGFSKALYSTWVFYKPDRLLLDCGEGVATAMGNGVFGIEKVLLTHGHMDHIAGLPVLMSSRIAAMGDTQKPLQIYYPRGDYFIRQMREYLDKSHRNLPYPLEWIELDENAFIPLSHQRGIETFRTQHHEKYFTLGYRVIERRKRLKPQFAQMSREEIAALVKTGGRDAAEQLSEIYQAKVLLFGGDGMPLHVDEIAGAEILFHEATLLDEAERDSNRHSTLREAVQVAAAAHVKALVLYHISGRYRMAEIKKRALAAQKECGATFPIWILFHNRLINLQA